jgi:heme/copper-type cytochrome/quinol oxidase subunit 3
MSNAVAHTHVHRDDEGAKTAMWLFLYTELLLFGALLSSMPLIAICTLRNFIARLLNSIQFLEL